MKYLKHFALMFVMAIGASISVTLLSLVWLSMIGGFYLLFDILKAYWPNHFVASWFWISLGFASVHTMVTIKKENE